jgi:hypothetical protein
MDDAVEILETCATGRIRERRRSVSRIAAYGLEMKATDGAAGDGDTNLPFPRPPQKGASPSCLRLFIASDARRIPDFLLIPLPGASN